MIRRITLTRFPFLNVVCLFWICPAQNVRNSLGKHIRGRGNEAFVVCLFGMLDGKQDQAGDVSDVNVTWVSTRNTGLGERDARIDVGDDTGCKVDFFQGRGEDKRRARDEANYQADFKSATMPYLWLCKIKCCGRVRPTWDSRSLSQIGVSSHPGSSIEPFQLQSCWPDKSCPLEPSCQVLQRQLQPRRSSLLR